MQNMISKILNVMEVSKYIGILDCVQTKRDHQLKMKELYKQSKIMNK